MSTLNTLIGKAVYLMSDYPYLSWGTITQDGNVFLIRSFSYERPKYAALIFCLQRWLISASILLTLLPGLSGLTVFQVLP